MQEDTINTNGLVNKMKELFTSISANSLTHNEKFGHCSSWPDLRIICENWSSKLKNSSDPQFAVYELSSHFFSPCRADSLSNVKCTYVAKEFDSTLHLAIPAKLHPRQAKDPKTATNISESPRSISESLEEELDDSDVLPGVRRRRCHSADEESSDGNRSSSEILYSDSEQDSSCFHDALRESVNDLSTNSLNNDVEEKGELIPENTLLFQDESVLQNIKCGGKDETETLDADEDKHNPAYVPRLGKFYMHDHRQCEEVEKQAKLSKSKQKSDVKRWQHDKFRYYEQVPKSTKEIIWRYGYNIRNSDQECTEKLETTEVSLTNASNTFTKTKGEPNFELKGTSNTTFSQKPQSSLVHVDQVCKLRSSRVSDVVSSSKCIKAPQIYQPSNKMVSRSSIDRRRFASYRQQYPVDSNHFSNEKQQVHSKVIKDAVGQTPPKYSQGTRTNQLADRGLDFSLKSGLGPLKSGYSRDLKMPALNPKVSSIKHTNVLSSVKSFFPQRGRPIFQKEAGRIAEDHPIKVNNPVDRPVCASESRSHVPNNRAPKRYSALRQNASVSIASSVTLLRGSSDVISPPKLVSGKTAEKNKSLPYDPTDTCHSKEFACDPEPILTSPTQMSYLLPGNRLEVEHKQSNVHMPLSSPLVTLPPPVTYDPQVPVNYAIQTLATAYLPNHLQQNVRFPTPGTILHNYLFSGAHQPHPLHNYFGDVIPVTNYHITPASNMCFPNPGSNTSDSGNQMYVLPVEMNAPSELWNGERRPLLGRRPLKPLEIKDPREMLSYNQQVNLKSHALEQSKLATDPVVHSS